MKTVFFTCDLCKADIDGQMSMFIFSDTLITAEFQQVPVKKEGHYCKACTDKIVTLIENLHDEARPVF